MGYPKSFSTSLQRNIFSHHPEIKYAGICCSGNSLDYGNDSIEILFESILKYANYHYYQNFIKNHKKNILSFIEKSDLPVVFSSEHLSMNFSLQGLDSKTKYMRINEIFSDYRINILLIKRSPVKFIRSIYSEYLKMGYRESYESFLLWLIRYSDRNFLLDLNYSKKEEQLFSEFVNIKVNWFDFEKLKKGDVNKNINQMTSDWLKISNLNLEFNVENKSLSKKELSSILKINNLSNRELGLSQTEPFERHRNKKILQLAGCDEKFIYENVILKRAAFEKMSEDGEQKMILRNHKLEKKILEIVSY